MANLFVLPALALVCLISGATEAIRFNNAYIQNVKTGSCVTIEEDKNFAPLLATKCTCAPYQLWKMEDGEQITNELDPKSYMDQLYGYPDNGNVIGVYGWTGKAWQKWRVNEHEDGSYTFVVQQTSKCLQEGSAGKVEQWDCDDNEPSQKWRVVQNPCGKLPEIPSSRFQLQNPETGLCAVILDDSDKYFAKVGTTKCSCEDNYHYWTWHKERLISEGYYKQCMANWEPGHPGVTQCACDYGWAHLWKLIPSENGTFYVVTQWNGKCAAGGGEHTQLTLDLCDKNVSGQKWRFFDVCKQPEPPKPTPPPTLPPAPPQPRNVIPEYLVFFFDNGNMDWLTPIRFNLLIGGHWDPVALIWYTVDGREIKPDTEQWTIYFGDVKPTFLNVLFPHGETWNEVFGWMTIDFFQTWQPKTPTPPQPTNVIPNYLVTFFNNGQMDWLTPERYNLLIGGRWDPVSLVWYTPNGRQIRPSTPDWTVYFGNLQPSELTVYFPSGGSWNDVFGWMTPTFFQQWTGWQQAVEVPYGYNIPIIISGYIPTAISQLFASGRVNWLTPDRVKMLAGGQWTGSEYITRTQVHLTPGTPAWTEYFGSTDPTVVSLLFSGRPGYWDNIFSWLTDAVKEIPSGMSPGSFPWDTFFGQMPMAG